MNKEKIKDILFLLGLRSLLYLKILKTGFTVLSADEFSRTLKAYFWAQKPRFILEGMWLPFGYYLEGIGLKLFNNLYWTPRIITAFFSFILISAVYLISQQLFKERKVALLAGIMTALDPIGTWIGASPISDTYCLAPLFLGILTYLIWREKTRLKFLFLSSLAFFLSSGFRYESWWFIFTFFLLIFKDLVFLKRGNKKLLFILLTILISGLFILIWCVANLIKYHHPLWFAQARTTYTVAQGVKIQPFLKSLVYYPKLFLSQPYLTLVIGFGFALVLIFLFEKENFRKRLSSPNHHLAFLVIPFVFLIGYNIFSVPSLAEPRRIIEYFVPLIIPYVAFLVTKMSEQVTRQNRVITTLGLGVGVSFFIDWQKNHFVFNQIVLNRFSLIIYLIVVSYLIFCFFFKEPILQNYAVFIFLFFFITISTQEVLRFKPRYREALKVGNYLKTSVIPALAASKEKILVQLHYWDFRAIIVASNQPDLFIFDGPFNPLVEFDQKFNFQKKYPKSILTEKEENISAFLKNNRIKYAVLLSPELKDYLKKIKNAKEKKKFKRWTVFKIE